MSHKGFDALTTNIDHFVVDTLKDLPNDNVDDGMIAIVKSLKGTGVNSIRIRADGKWATVIVPPTDKQMDIWELASNNAIQEILDAFDTGEICRKDILQLLNTLKFNGVVEIVKSL